MIPVFVSVCVFIISPERWCVRLKWLLSWPLSVLLYFTIPDCNLPQWERWYLLTFLSSTLWIALYSYVMVWMVRNTVTHQHTCVHTHIHTYTHTHTHINIHSLLPLCLCPGDRNQLHTWNSRSHHGHHFSSSRHQCPRLYGQPHCRPTRCVYVCLNCLST